MYEVLVCGDGWGGEGGKGEYELGGGVGDEAVGN